MKIVLNNKVVFVNFIYHNSKRKKLEKKTNKKMGEKSSFTDAAPVIVTK